jgi:hypothetical protein
MYKMAFET